MTDDGFRELFTAQFGRMVSLARLLGARDPEDVAQEAFARTYARWSTINDPSAAPAYLRRAVINLCRNAARQQKIRRLSTVPDPLVAASAEASALDRQDLAAVLQAIARLPRRRREALILRHWFGLSYQDVADAMHISPGGARSLVHRATTDLSQITAPSIVREKT